MKEIGIGLLGFGTVGVGVVEGLQNNGDIIAEQLGARPVIRRIADLDTTTDRGVEVPKDMLTTDAMSVIGATDTDIIVELVGGTTVARDFVLAALSRGKPVVTANKALIAHHGREILALAGEKNTDIYFEASVGGGIPIIRSLREGLMANRISSIYGILNGTCNYILTSMESEGLSFDTALDQAQKKGYAEADPSLDIDGNDTAHKAAILAALAYGLPLDLENIRTEGIRGLSEMDIEYARDLGYRIKLLAVIKKVRSEIEVGVHPTMLPVDHVLSSVRGVFNAVMVHGDMAGDTLYYGRGAGREPTASAVIADIGDVARNLLCGSPRRVPAIARAGDSAKLMDMSEVMTRYYMRLALVDEPGALARIAGVLGNHGVSIASVLQKESRAGEHVPVIIVTQQAPEKRFSAAVAEMDALDIVGARTVRYRIEE